MKGFTECIVRVELEPGERIEATDFEESLAKGRASCASDRKSVFPDSDQYDLDNLRCALKGTLDPRGAVVSCESSKCSQGTLQKVASGIISAASRS